LSGVDRFPSVSVVAKERLKSPRARLFVALDLADDIREALGAWQAAECRDPALRPIASQALHLTLCFLGYHPERAIDRIAEIVTGVRPRPVPLRFDAQPVPLPRGRPRLFAIGAESDASIALQAELSDELEAARLLEPEKRGFWPHVTVARVRAERRKGSSGRGRRGRPQHVDRPPERLPASLLEPIGCVRVALYRSILKPQGAEHVRLAGLDLPPVQGEEGDLEDE
jgi:RNA 2',3'-cyclic 3'-phosphodiesterase